MAVKLCVLGTPVPVATQVHCSQWSRMGGRGSQRPFPGEELDTQQLRGEGLGFGRVWFGFFETKVSLCGLDCPGTLLYSLN